MKLFTYQLSNGFGFFLEIKNEIYFIAPYHVLFFNYLKRGITSVKLNEYYVEDALLVNVKGELSNDYDLMFGKLKTNKNFLFDIFVEDEYQPKIKKKILSKNALNTNSNFVIINSDITFSKIKVKFSNILQVPKISKKGDSGKLVIQDKQNLLGMLIADSNQFSYLLSFDKILSYIKKNSLDI